MTQLEKARRGVMTEEMRFAAAAECCEAQTILDGVAAGRIVIPSNVNGELTEPRAIGAGLKTKVNANIGASQDYPDVDEELAKLTTALEAGADAVMDLSTGGDVAAIRREIRAGCPVPLGTVPIYEAAVRVIAERGSVVDLTADDLFSVIESQAREGVDFMTLHCGVTRESVARLQKQGRLTDVVSRGGAFLVCWMLGNESENPLYTRYDDILEIAREHDVTLSLGDGLRPGSLADATDRAQVQELIILGELVKRARAAGVQAMVEGPGHVPLDQIAANVMLQKRLCEGAPFYVLGPIVTDVAPGYDHITSAIGGALAAMAGADFLCYVTPSEHLGLPTVEDVREGVIAARIAGHAADVAKGVRGAMDWDCRMSSARKARDWAKQVELAIDPVRAGAVREKRSAGDEDVCSMCSSFCAMKIVEEYLGSPAQAASAPPSLPTKVAQPKQAE
ncbi:MAG: phosphomethylpyrimidine synthase ThiC [Armatimonadota bacterium]|nr:phosphomethylpyrimidine synthase ThiC [Armatimonadota bacterium]